MQVQTTDCKQVKYTARMKMKITVSLPKLIQIYFC
jgi:hypothetical protein